MPIVETLKDLIKLGLYDPATGTVPGSIFVPHYIVIRQDFAKGAGWGTSYTFTDNENGTLSNSFATSRIQPSKPVEVTDQNGFPVYSNYVLRTEANRITATVDASGNITLSNTPSSAYPYIRVHAIYELASGETIAGYIEEDIITTPEISASRFSVDIDYDNSTSGLTAANVKAALDELTVKKDVVTIIAGRTSASATNIYLRLPDGLPSNLSPAIVPFNARIVAISAGTFGNHTWTAEIHSNLSLITGATLSITGASSGYRSDLSINVNAGDRIELYCNGTAIAGPQILVFLERR